MTLKDIQKQVAALGFEREIDTDDSFISAVNRAFSIIYTERAIHKSMRFYRNPILPNSHIPILTHECKECISLPTSAKAYSFYVSGNAKIRISQKSGEIIRQFNSQNAKVRGFIEEGATIEFFGDFRYTVYDLATFDTLESDREEDIPFYESVAVYDLSKTASDFRSAIELPEDANGKKIENSSVCNTTLVLPYRYSGQVNLKYRASAPVVSPDEADNEIDIPKEIEHLVPLLAAAYVWLDDDSDKAQYYMSLYREQMAAVKLYSTQCLSPEYQDVLRWT